jgi:hypothetical protein
VCMLMTEKKTLFTQAGLETFDVLCVGLVGNRNFGILYMDFFHLKNKLTSCQLNYESKGGGETRQSCILDLQNMKGGLEFKAAGCTSASTVVVARMLCSVACKMADRV